VLFLHFQHFEIVWIVLWDYFSGNIGILTLLRSISCAFRSLSVLLCRQLPVPTLLRVQRVFRKIDELEGAAHFRHETNVDVLELIIEGILLPSILIFGVDYKTTWFI